MSPAIVHSARMRWNTVRPLRSAHCAASAEFWCRDTGQADKVVRVRFELRHGYTGGQRGGDTWWVTLTVDGAGTYGQKYSTARAETRARTAYSEAVLEMEKATR